MENKVFGKKEEFSKVKEAVNDIKKILTKRVEKILKNSLEETVYREWKNHS